MQSMIKGAVALAVLAALTLPAKAADKITVITDFPPVSEHAALHLAKVKGWYQEAGLDVDIQDGKGSINAIQLVGAGQVDVGYASLGPIALAKEQGMDLISIAGFGRKTDLAVIVPADSKINTPKDLKGKSIALFTTSPWTPFVEPFFKANGMAVSDVNMVYVDPTAVFVTYSGGTTDAVMTLAPFGLPLLNPKRPSRAILAVDSGISFPGFGLLTRNEVIKSKRAQLAKLAQITSKAWDYIFEGHQDEGAESIVKDRPDVKLDMAVVRGQIDLYKVFAYSDATKGQPMGIQAEKDWADGIKSMEAAKMIKPGHKPSEYFTNELLQK